MALRLPARSMRIRPKEKASFCPIERRLIQPPVMARSLAHRSESVSVGTDLTTHWGPKWVVLPVITTSRSGACGAPATMQKPFDGGEQCLVNREPDENDDQHDADDLIHGVQLTAVVQELSQTEARQYGNENLR